jgi:hypothetical protein
LGYDLDLKCGESEFGKSDRKGGHWLPSRE